MAVVTVCYLCIHVNMGNISNDPQKCFAIGVSYGTCVKDAKTDLFGIRFKDRLGFEIPFQCDRAFLEYAHERGWDMEAIEGNQAARLHAMKRIHENALLDSTTQSIFQDLAALRMQLLIAYDEVKTLFVNINDAFMVQQGLQIFSNQTVMKDALGIYNSENVVLQSFFAGILQSCRKTTSSAINSPYMKIKELMTNLHQPTWYPDLQAKKNLTAYFLLQKLMENNS